jgi:large repetitive protein
MPVGCVSATELTTATLEPQVVEMVMAQKVGLSLVVFDGRVADLDVLHGALVPGTVAYTLEPETDALVVITRLLAETGATQLAIVAHGEPGSIHLGAQPIDLARLRAQAGLLQEWGVKEISLYSCEVGTDAAFVDELVALTGAQVAASTKKVGSAELGGSWKLTEKTQPIFNAHALQNYSGLLETTIDDVTADNVLNIAEVGGNVTITGMTTDIAEDAIITLRVNGSDYTGNISGGAFSIDVPGSILEADADAIIEVLDSGNNAIAMKSYVVDTVTPNPTIIFDDVTADNVLNITEADGGVAITGTTTDTNAEDTVTLVVNGATYTGTVAADGTFSINVSGADLAADIDATIDALVTTTDAAGNAATADTTKVYAVDTVAPSPTIAIDDVTIDNVLNIVEAGGNVAITGTTVDTNVGDTVTLIVNGVSYLGTVGSEGTFSITVSGADLAADSNVTIDASVTTTDTAGNSATANTAKVYAVDIVAPSPTIAIDDVTTDNVLNIAEAGGNVAIIGTTVDTNVGDTVTLTVNGVSYSGTVDSEGTFSITVSGDDLATDSNVTIDASVTTTDEAGNTSMANTTKVYAVDVVAPTLTIAIDDVTPDNVLNITEAGGDVAITGITVDANVGDTVTLTVNGVSYSGTVDSEGTFSINVSGADLVADVDATIDASVTTTDAAGNAATGNTTKAYVVDVVAPSIPAIAPTINLDSGASATDNITNDPTPALTGTADPNSIVQLLINGTPFGDPLTVGSSGEWSFTPTADLSDGVYNITATATDAVGNTSDASEPLSITIDTTVPTGLTPGSASIDENNLANAVVATLSATDIGAGAVTFALVPDQGDNADFTMSGNDLQINVVADAEVKSSYSVVIRATDAAGNFTDFTRTITINDVDEFDVSPISDINAAQIEVSENAAVGTLVGITASASDADVSNNAITYSLTDDAGGLFAIDANTGVVTVAGVLDYETAASHDITVQAASTDGSASTETFTINLNAPSTVDISSDKINFKIGETATVTFTFSEAPVGFTGDDIDTTGGAISNLVATSNPLVYTATFTPTAGVNTLSGSIAINAGQFQDADGNNNLASNTLAITGDTLAPTAVITGISDDTGASATDGVTRDRTLLISGTTTEGNSTVTVLQGTTEIGTATADASGNWEFDYQGTALGDGDYAFTAVATDEAGNSGPASAAFNVTVDNIAPIQTAILNTMTLDSGLSATDFITNNGSAGRVYNGTLSAALGTGESLEISINGGSTWSSVSNVAGTNWNFTDTVEKNASWNVQTRVVDLAGNAGQNSIRAITLDTTVPNAIASITRMTKDSGISSTDFITRDGTAGRAYHGTLSGTLAAGERVQFSVNGGATWLSASVNTANNTWSASDNAAKSGNWTLQTRVIDIAGNINLGASRAVTLDTVAPAVANIGGYTTTSVVGTAEAGSRVRFSTSASNPGANSFAGLAGPVASNGSYSIGYNSLTGSTAGISYYLFTEDAAGNLGLANSNRVVVGTAGADTLSSVGVAGSDLLFGGFGRDTARYAAVSSAISRTGQISPGAGAVNIRASSIDVLTGVETLQITGTNYTSTTTVAVPGTNQLRSTVQVGSSLDPQNNAISAFIGSYNEITGNFSVGSSNANATLVTFDTFGGNNSNQEAFLFLNKTSMAGSSISLSGGTVTLSGL